jgi:hypothetical protein
MSKGKALAIVGIEGLDFECGAVALRKQSDAALSHGTVHIHEK